MFYKLGQDSALDALGFTKQAVSAGNLLTPIVGGAALGGVGGAISGDDYSAKRILGGAALGAGAGVGAVGAGAGIGALRSKAWRTGLAKRIEKADLAIAKMRNKTQMRREYAERGYAGAREGEFISGGRPKMTPNASAGYDRNPLLDPEFAPKPSGASAPIIKADERASQFMRPQSRSLFEAEGEFNQLLDRLHPGTPAYDNAMTALNKIQKQITRQEATPRAWSLAKKHIDRGGGTGGF